MQVSVAHRTCCDEAEALRRGGRTRTAGRRVRGLTAEGRRRREGRKRGFRRRKVAESGVRVSEKAVPAMGSVECGGSTWEGMVVATN